MSTVMLNDKVWLLDHKQYDVFIRIYNKLHNY